MKNVSASKLVFLMLALTVCVSFIIGKLEAKDFMLLAGMAFTFYFSNKGDSTQEFLGK
jgi:putative solute:sodium symporter small subunit